MVDIGALSTFDLGGFNQSLAGIQNSGSVANSSTASDSTLTLTGVGGSSYTGVIKDVLSPGNKKVALTINASGSVIVLSGTHTYTGATTLNAGGLRVTGSLASGSAVTVNVGILSGTGTVAGTVAIADINTAGIQAGTGTGTTTTLTVGALTFLGTNARLQVTTNGTTACSLVTSTGAVTLGGATVNLLAALNAGTYTLIGGASMSGTVTVGTNNTGRTVTSCTVVGNNLVLVLT